MKFFVLMMFFSLHSAFACDVKGLKKEIFDQFSPGMPITNVLGEQQAITTVKESSVTDSLMRIRGEDFFITRLVFNILWNNGHREEREILMAAIVDMAACRIESFESGETFGSSTTKNP